MARPGHIASGTGAGSTRALVLATVAFLAAFYVWALFGPLAPTLQKTLGLSDAQLPLLVAIPLLLGSVLRVPMGALTIDMELAWSSRPCSSSSRSADRAGALPFQLRR